jgi:hypothetical protein
MSFLIPMMLLNEGQIVQKKESVTWRVRIHEAHADCLEFKQNELRVFA